MLQRILLLLLFAPPIASCTQESNPVQCTINQEEYNKDEALFLSGLVVLANVIQIFLEPQNIPKVKRHVDQVMQGVVNFAQELFKKETPS